MPDLIKLLASSLQLSNCLSRRSSSIKSHLLARTRTYWCKVDVLISCSFTRASNLARMLKSACRASLSSEAKGNTSINPSRKGKSGRRHLVQLRAQWWTITCKIQYRTKEHYIYPLTYLKLNQVHQRECLQLRLPQWRNSWQPAQDWSIQSLNLSSIVSLGKEKKIQEKRSMEEKWTK